MLRQQLVRRAIPISSHTPPNTISHHITKITQRLQSTSMAPKLRGRAFYESLGSPKYIVAPMVDQSEFAWRLLTRSFLPAELRTSILAYSPMLHAKLFSEKAAYRTCEKRPGSSVRKIVGLVLNARDTHACTRAEEG